jgi:serine/threonine protein phosphatase PrpC
MLTFIEAISLAGDRRKQNDDACGFTENRGWVIDGATDLHQAPLTGAASDAAWFAHYVNVYLHGPVGDDAIGEVTTAAAGAFDVLTKGRSHEPWQLPTASFLMIEEHGREIHGVDLGDCRCFALDADGAAHEAGSRGHQGADDEQERARDASKRAGQTPLLRDPDTLAMLRAVRATHNRPGGYWVLGLQPEATDHARNWMLPLKRPAHLLLATDGFSALTDRYRVYDAAGLVRAALDKGLQELARELREIETADASGSRHPRFKPSDDATALLMRLS